MRVVISGYYGFGNLGDEAVLAAMLPALRARIPAAEFTVLSANPGQTVQLHGVRSAPRTGLGAVRAVSGAGLFISGGGGLLQDVTSARSALYYLGTLGLATVRARRTMLFAQGVGPFQRRWVSALTRLTLDRVDLISVRDPASRDLLLELGVHQTIHIVADPAFALVPAPPERAEELLRGLPRPRVGISLRSWGNDAFVDPLIAGLRTWCARTGAVPVFLAFHRSRDLGISQRLADALGGQVLPDVRPTEMMAVIGAVDLLVGMRLHALIGGVAMGVPMVGLSYDPKVDALFQRVNVGPLLSVSTLQAPQVHDGLHRAWAARADMRARLLQHAVSLRADALRAADLAAALVASPDGTGAS